MGKINGNTLRDIADALEALDGEVRNISYNDLNVEVDFACDIPEGNTVDQDILDVIDSAQVNEWKYELENLRDLAEDLALMARDAHEAAYELASVLDDAEEQKSASTEVEVGDKVQFEDRDEMYVLAIVFDSNEEQHAWIAPTLPDEFGRVGGMPVSVATEALTLIESAVDRANRLDREAAARAAAHQQQSTAVA